MTQQKEKQTHVVFGIEQDAFFKNQVHPNSLYPMHRKSHTPFAHPTHQRNGIPCFQQSSSGAMHTLVGDQIVGNGYYCSFQDS
jgi:hypothetical protein